MAIPFPYTTLDIELSEPLPDNGQWSGQGIACIATATGDDPDSVSLWYPGMYESAPGAKGGSMSQEEIGKLLVYLYSSLRPVVTWNGAAFDLRILSELGGSRRICRELALPSYDPMFQFARKNGFPVSLDACTKGMRVPGKMEGIHGRDVPKLWNTGVRQREAVLRYVSQDVLCLRTLFEAIHDRGELVWVLRSGDIKRVPFPDLLTVEEVLATPAANNNWMTNPMNLSLPWLE